MKTFTLFIFLSAGIYLISCSNESSVVQEKQINTQKLSDENVFKDYETALDKAKGVDQTIQDAAEMRRKEIEKQGLYHH
jgi:hypothetical protein